MSQDADEKNDAEYRQQGHGSGFKPFDEAMRPTMFQNTLQAGFSPDNHKTVESQRDNPADGNTGHKNQTEPDCLLRHSVCQ